jgi:hypothetical protein
MGRQMEVQKKLLARFWAEIFMHGMNWSISTKVGYEMWPGQDGALEIPESIWLLRSMTV